MGKEFLISFHKQKQLYLQFYKLQGALCRRVDQSSSLLLVYVINVLSYS